MDASTPQYRERRQLLAETYDRGVAAMRANEPDRAAECFRAAAEIDPSNPTVLNSLGVAQQTMGRYEDALRSYNCALALEPKHPGRLNNRGNALQLLGRYAEAVADYDAALALASGYTDAHVNRGNALIALNRHHAALEDFERALALSGNHVNAHLGRGNALLALRRFEAALVAYERGLQLQPANADLHFKHGIALHGLDRAQAAVASFDRALALRPIFPNALTLRGNALRELGHLERALASYEAALEQDPNHADAHNNRGIVLLAMDRLDQALAAFEASLSLRPHSAEIWTNRGNALIRMLQVDAALSSFDQAITQAGDFAPAQFSRACTLLLAGDFRQGWQQYEWRYAPIVTPEISLRSPVIVRNFSQPPWRGDEPIAGKTILLYAEQGFGDTLQFCRYAPLVAAMGATVILEVQQPLVELFKTLPGVAQVLATGSRLPHFDCHCSLMSLPLAFGTELASIPTPSVYLRANSERVSRWRSKLGPRLQPRVGLAWSGNPKFIDHARKSIPLATLLAALPRDVQFVTLQREISAADRSVLAERKGVILDVSTQLTDFAETAALCGCLDMTIAVDTSSAHLSAALGRPTWIVLPHCPDWRWLLAREDSPWYATAKLYRQEVPGDWTEPLKRLGTDLEHQPFSSQDEHMTP